MVRAYIGTVDFEGLRRLVPAPDDEACAPRIGAPASRVSSFWAAADDEVIEEVRFLLHQGERLQALEMLGARAIDLVAIRR